MQSTNQLITKIEDTGVGMLAEDLKNLFTFFSCLENTKNINRSGMGLGLSISKMIIQQLGGEITVSSKSNEGSTFIFQFPVDSFEVNPSQ